MSELDPNWQCLETQAQFQHAVMQVVATARLRLVVCFVNSGATQFFIR